MPNNTEKMRAIETIKHGDNGEVAQPGEEFFTTKESATQLEELGHAERLGKTKTKDQT